MRGTSCVLGHHMIIIARQFLMCVVELWLGMRMFSSLYADRVRTQGAVARQTCWPQMIGFLVHMFDHTIPALRGVMKLHTNSTLLKKKLITIPE